MSIALYIHVPYCLSRCGYCDFTSVSDPDVRTPIVRALVNSVTSLTPWLGGVDVGTVYIGGGTPTGLGDGILDVTAALKPLVRPSLREFTVETNPDTSDPALIDALVAAGATRFSLGVQSFDESTLEVLGRRHSAESAREALRTLKESGARVSLDLIAGVPGQSDASWIRDVEEAVASGVGHVSVYPLTLSEGAPLFDVLDPDDDTAADRLEQAGAMLTSSGFTRYEIASFVRPGEASLHNTAYWTGVEYLGLGPSASSMLSVQRFNALSTMLGWGITPREGSARVRFTFAPDVHTWIDDPLCEPVDLEFLTEAQAAREDLMLALRMTEGAPRTLVEHASHLNPHLKQALRSLEDAGLAAWVSAPPIAGKDVTQRFALSERGWLLGNEVFGRIWNVD